MMIDRTKSVESNPKNQYLAAVVVNIFVIGFGVNCGWSSPNIVLLQSDDTPLPSGKITNDEASWIASIIMLGGLLGTVCFGVVMKLFGRKYPLMALSIPMIVSWLLVIFAQNVYYLYIARLLHGTTAGAIVTIAPVYLTELANDNLRGFLSSSVILTAHFGVFLAFAFGNYCSYNTPAITMIVLSFLFVVCFSFFPETPTYLLKQNRVDEAEKSILFYRSLRESEFEKLSSEMEKLTNAIGGADEGKSKGNSFKWSDVTTRPGSKALTIGIVLVILNQFGGCNAMMNYTASIFQEAGSTLSPNMSAMIVAAIQFVGTCLVNYLVDRTGRKFLYVLSTFGTTFGLITFGIYMMLKSWNYAVEESFRWIPLAALSIVIFFASCAILTLPFTVIGEMMPEQIKDLSVTFCMALMATFGFILLKTFPWLMGLLGFHVSMFLFAGVCLSCAVFIIFYMPETKDKSYEKIMTSLQ